MILQICAAILVLGIAFFQVVQGLFSALIMAVLSIFSAVVAFNYYEPLAELVAPHQPASAHAVSLFGLFVIVLLVLRVLFDLFLSGNVVLGVWADRVGGGVLGLVSGMILVGVLTVSLEMLPWGPSILMYRDFDKTLQRQSSLAPFFPDEFTVGLMGLLSDGSLASGKSWTAQHPNFIRENFGFRNDAGIDARLGAPENSIKVPWAHARPNDRQGWRADLPLELPMLTESEIRDSVVLVVRTQVADSARSEVEGGGNWWRLPATHFQLVTAQGRRLYPVAYLTRGNVTPPRRGGFDSYKAYRGAGTSEDWTAVPPEPAKNDDMPQLAQLAVQRKWYSDGGPEWLNVDWVYYLPDGDEPAYLVFRRAWRVKVPEMSLQALPVSDDQPALLRHTK
jgi:hypothetical protein